MISWLTGESKPPSYVELRAAGKSMFEKIMAVTELSSGFDLVKAARALGLPTPGKVLFFDGEGDMTALMDFYLAEFSVQGRTLAETVDATAAGLTRYEADHLEAFRRSRTSLFHAHRILPATQQIVLRDVLEPERPEVFLTDISLSGTLQRLGAQLLLFFRVLEVEGIFMSSGLLFPFDPADADRLVQSFRQKMKKVSPAEWNQRKFAFFYAKHRQFGIEQGYADVTPT